MRLSELLKHYRWATRKGLRPLAKELGFSAATLNRIERGDTPSGESLAKILRWLLEED